MGLPDAVGDGPVCPVCEQPAQATTTVRMGANWEDAFGRPPHSLFSTYQMVHVGGASEDGQTLRLFLHGQGGR